MTAPDLSAPLPPTQPILGVDTALGVCAVAVLAGDQVLARRSVRAARGAGEILVPMIGETLAAAGLGFGELAAIAVNVGPGTFTGIRIGLATAVGLRLARRIPVLGISGFEAIAAECRATGAWRPDSGVLAVCFDSRRGNLFVQLFDSNGAHDPEDLAPAAAVVRVAGSALLAGDGAGLIAGSMLVAPGPGEPDPATLARLARDAPALRILPARPIYLRPPDARLPAA